ncbi:M20/M25/M40 family metallo-hydrolase [Candidatus Woesearchaeota archaeon]|nr:M20/M25/M40 family metallo-hydrolase [Candidatus Woesearchaeota archaeon]
MNVEELCSRLVKIDSCISDTGLAESNFQTELLRIIRAEYSFDDIAVQEVKDGNYKAKNVVVRRRFGDAEKKILFVAHADTAPLYDREDWAFPPFSGALSNGRILGKGAVDDKAGLASILHALGTLHSSPEYNGEIIMASVVREEDLDHIRGAKVLMESLDKEIKDSTLCCVVKEPTRNKFCTASQGLIVFYVSIYGENIHTGARSSLIEARKKQGEVLDATDLCEVVLAGLKNFDRKIMHFSHPLFETHSMNLAISRINGFSSYSSLPGKVTITGQIYTFPNYKPMKIFKDLKLGLISHLVQEVGEKNKEKIRIVPIYLCGSFQTDLNDTPEFRKILEVVNPQFSVMHAICDATVIAGQYLGPYVENWESLRSKGAFPVVVHGPGDAGENNAHRKNEYVEIANLRESLEHDKKLMDLFLRSK